VTVNSYDVCAKNALDLGFIPGQKDYDPYICECMGRITGRGRC
jgi:hypothetical protein